MARQSKAKKTKPKVKRKTKVKRPSRSAINKRKERQLEEGLEESFPASDPPAITDPTRGERAP